MTNDINASAPLEGMRSLRQWVIADSGKIPFDPKRLTPASVSDPATWASYEEAVAARNGRFPFIGFVFTTEDPPSARRARARPGPMARQGASTGASRFSPCGARGASKKEGGTGTSVAPSFPIDPYSVNNSACAPAPPPTHRSPSTTSTWPYGSINTAAGNCCGTSIGTAGIQASMAGS